MRSGLGSGVEVKVRVGIWFRVGIRFGLFARGCGFRSGSNWAQSRLKHTRTPTHSSHLTILLLSRWNDVLHMPTQCCACPVCAYQLLRFDDWSSRVRVHTRHQSSYVCMCRQTMLPHLDVEQVAHQVVDSLDGDLAAPLAGPGVDAGAPRAYCGGQGSTCWGSGL